MKKMRIVFVIWLCLFVVPSCYAFESEQSSDPCETPAACIEKLLSIVDVNSAVSATPAEPELRIMKRLQSFGVDAVSSVVPLLSKPNRYLARSAAKFLNDIEQVDAQYIPQISRALDEHRIWLFPVLGRIGTAEAGEALVRYYLHQSSPGNELYDQLIENLKLLDGAVVPGLMKALQCEYGCERDNEEVLGKIASAMNERVQVLISEALLRTAEDTENNYELRNSALSVMWHLGEANLAIDEELLILAAEEKELAFNIRFILGNSGSKRLVEFFINALSQVDDEEGIYDAIVALSDLGVDGQPAGEKVTQLLEHKATKIRIVAARTLGYIEYLPSVPKLIDLANTDGDVRVAWAAVESLGRMHATSAVQDLQHIAESHWYPPVVAAAVKALAHINSNQPSLLSHKFS